MLATIAIFLAASAAIAILWNRFFPRVPWRIVAVFGLLCAAYQAETLFTTRVDRRGVASDDRDRDSGLHQPQLPEQQLEMTRRPSD